MKGHLRTHKLYIYEYFYEIYKINIHEVGLYWGTSLEAKASAVRVFMCVPAERNADKSNSYKDW